MSVADLIIKLCEFCNKEFTPKWRQQVKKVRFCSGSCRSRFISRQRRTEAMGREEPAEKACLTCSKIQPISEFRKTESGRRNKCRNCTRLDTCWRRGGETANVIKKIEREEFLSSHPDLKYCAKGDHYENRTGFAQSSKCRDGLFPTCKQCQKQHRTINAATIAVQRKEYRTRNRIQISQERRLRYLENKELYSNKNKAYREKHATKLADRSKAYYKDNKLKLIFKARDYYRNNRDSIREKQKHYYAKNRKRYAVHSQNRRAQKRGASGSFTHDLWAEKLKYFGYACYLCGEDLRNKKIHRDHRIPLCRGGTNYIANIAPACSRCNLQKGTKTEAEFFLWKWMRDKKVSSGSIFMLPEIDFSDILASPRTVQKCFKV